MLLDANTPLLSWVATSEDVGGYDITLEVADGKGGVTLLRFELVVSAG